MNTAGQIPGKVVRISDVPFPGSLSRRHLLAGIAISAFMPSVRATADRASLLLKAEASLIRPGSGQPEIGISGLSTDAANGVARFPQRSDLDITLRNDLPAPVALNWYGLDGVPAIEPLLIRPAVPSGKTDRFALPTRQAGTFLSDIRFLEDPDGPPSGAQAVIVAEATPAEVDRDELFVIEDWPTNPGDEAKGTHPTANTSYTVNKKPSPDIVARANERLRFRFINACQRNAIALEIQNHDVRVMAIDSQPAEPFLARGGRIVLAPGSRIDAFIDATSQPGSTSAIVLHDGVKPRTVARLLTSKDAPFRPAPLSIPAPLPSNGLPAHLDLKNALRVSLPLDASAALPSAWVKPTAFPSTLPPAFRAKRGRTVVLALGNATATPQVFRLHGHHFRLLDRLDDGWKPYWLDTLLIDAGQTQRIAFLAEYPGRWLMEAMRPNWPSPRGLRWFAVE
jgi:FtsP/CotA-like multicopper oxidase with cupredoxin domain